MHHEGVTRTLFFNNCYLEQTEQFYSDINYYVNNKKIFRNDEFDIINSIKKIIDSINSFVPLIKSNDLIYQLIHPDSNTTLNKINIFYQLNINILKKYNMTNILNTISKHLKIPENVYHRIKKKYTGPLTEVDDYIFCCLVRQIIIIYYFFFFRIFKYLYVIFIIF